MDWIQTGSNPKKKKKVSEPIQLGWDWIGQHRF